MSPDIIQGNMLSNFVSLPWKLDNPYCHRLLVSYLSVKVKFRSHVFHFLDGWSNQRRCVQIVDFKRIHQIVSPILNFESTNSYIEYFYDCFFNWETEKKNLVWNSKKFVFIFNCSNWERFVEKFRETNWWKYLMNPTFVKIE